MQAQDLPALYAVSGVASDDVLNIRTEPRAQADKIGELAHDARDVEVMAFNDDRSWGRVNTGERSGWTSMRYLAPQPAGDLPVAERLSCAGTEPFWSLDIRQSGESIYSSPGDKATRLDSGQLEPAAGRRDRFLLPFAGDAWAVIRRELCSDGMSDRAYGLDIDVHLGTGPLRSGCCTIVAP